MVNILSNSLCARTILHLFSSPSAYPHLTSSSLDDLQHDISSILSETLSHPSLHPNNLTILRNLKSWLLNLDLIIVADSGNTYDAVFMAARAALWDTKVPRTRSVEYKARKSRLATTTTSTTEGGSGNMDIDEDTVSGFDTRQVQTATDFELSDYWDEGEVLDGRQRWPVCITLNLVKLENHSFPFLTFQLMCCLFTLDIFYTSSRRYTTRRSCCPPSTPLNVFFRLKRHCKPSRDAYARER